MNELTVLSNTAVSNIIDAVKPLQVIKTEDLKFLQEHKEHLATILNKCHMWRTDIQKESIVSDIYHPTIHSKFHQAILEQKVQFEQALYLAKDFEVKKMDIESRECDLEETEETISKAEGVALKRALIEKRRIEMDIKFKHFELQQQQIAMEYRMQEVKGWQVIEDRLLKVMRAEGLNEDVIWSKNAGEMKSMFYMTLTNLQGIKKTTDGGEYTNLMALAAFSVQQVKEAGLFEMYVKDLDAAQLDSLRMVESVVRK
jgi:hypothetical protein